jgi:hypothetical protein
MVVLGAVGPMLLSRLLFENWYDCAAVGITFDLTVYPLMLFVYGIHMRRQTIPHETVLEATRHNLYRLFLPYTWVSASILLTAIVYFTVPTALNNLTSSQWSLIIYAAEFVSTMIAFILFAIAPSNCCRSSCMMQLYQTCTGDTTYYPSSSSSSRYSSIPRTI